MGTVNTEEPDGQCSVRNLKLRNSSGLDRVMLDPITIVGEVKDRSDLQNGHQGLGKTVEMVHMQRGRALQGFISYAHADDQFLTDARPYLTELQRLFGISVWDDHQLKAGTTFSDSIRERIRIADIIIMLLSPNFFHSCYIKSIELPEIKCRRQRGALVLPIIIQRCAWRYITSNMHAIPHVDGRIRPISEWRPRSHGFDHAREQIADAIEHRFAIRRLEFDWDS
jgi:hypothetical protein